MQELDVRSQAILTHIAEAYCEDGEPVGSKTIAQRLNMSLSPATVRNIMGDLERLGLLYAPHTSAGRLPTTEGLRFFVRYLLENPSPKTHTFGDMEPLASQKEMGVEKAIEHVTTTLSGLAKCAGIVSVPKLDAPLQEVNFVRLNPDRALVVLITEDGAVENRVISVAPELSSSMLVEAANYFTHTFKGLSLLQAQKCLREQMTSLQMQLDHLTATLVHKGFDIWSSKHHHRALIVKGAANLLGEINDDTDIAHLRELFQFLEDKEVMARLLEASIDAQGVQIFIGSENPLFEHDGCSVVVTPYRNLTGQVVGALGVIGPTHINYRQVINVVDYSARLLTYMLG